MKSSQKPILSVSKSRHARARQQQRSVSDEAVDVTLRWGRVIPQEKRRTAYFLDRNCVELAARAGECIARFQGTAVIQAADNTIVTVIRCSDSHRLKRWIR